MSDSQQEQLTSTNKPKEVEQEPQKEQKASEEEIALVNKLMKDLNL